MMKTIYFRFACWLMSTAPMSFPPGKHAHVLNDLASPAVRRAAKIIPVFLVMQVIAIPIAATLFGLSDREATAFLDLLGWPLIVGIPGCFLVYLVSSALWHAGFRPGLVAASDDAPTA